MIRRLSSLPTLRQLYANGTLRPKADIARTADDKFLDVVSLVQGDITQLEVDAIVNAANKSLLGGGGVDGAIHRAAGRELLEECKLLNGCETGDAKVTGGFNLPAKHVIHTVGPVFSKSKEEEKARLLASCYRRSLEICEEKSFVSIAFPAISTGVYGYPVESATLIALAETKNFLSQSKHQMERVVFTVFSDEDRQTYIDLIPQFFPLAAD